MPSPDAPKPFSDIPDWLRELFKPKPPCPIHDEPQPCLRCALTPKESPGTIPIGVPIDDENGDQHGVE